MSSQENKTMIRRFLEEVWNNEDLSVLDELVADSYLGHDPGVPGGVIGGREALKGHFALLRSAFPDVRMTIEDIIAEGDRTAVRYSVHGRHTGSFAGMPPTGRQARICGMLLSRFAGARIAEEWAVNDTLGLLQQLGTIPAPEAVETP